MPKKPEPEENYFLDYQKLYAELHANYKILLKRVSHLEKIAEEHNAELDAVWREMDREYD